MSVVKWHGELIGQKVVEALKKNGFDAIYCSSCNEAVEYVLQYVQKRSRVGFGGSMTLETLQLAQRVEAKGGIVLNHNRPGLGPEEKLEIQREEILCDLFLCSINAVTLDGWLVNVDGVGNRVAALTFGPKKVIALVGKNKICSDISVALNRIKTLAAPMNCKRLNLDNPCIKTGTCMDCASNSRICRVYSVMVRRPMSSDITVVLVGEDLGF
ncbi:lactate utilization protein [Neomoorella thermoacetica]|nr:lactate utilization protein [Moorella thermoacetica]